MTSKFMSTSRLINQVTVLGFGQMGQGIAQVAAMAGYQVNVHDADIQKLKAGHMAVYRQVEEHAKKNIVNKNYGNDIGSEGMSPSNQTEYVRQVMGRIVVPEDFSTSIEAADLIIEAIVEDRETKLKFFQNLANHPALDKSTIIASNTSSFSIKEMATASKNRLDKTVGLHFFNPVPKMKLVELITLEETKPSVIEGLKEFISTIGKEVVLCKDTPGFIVNRLLIPYLFESVRLAESGSASIEDIDKAMKLGAGYPMGPFTLLDFVGLDTARAVLLGWHESDPGNPLYRPSEWIDRLVREGNLGRKSGAGFYSYGQDQIKESSSISKEANKL